MGRIVCAASGGFILGVMVTVIIFYHLYGVIDRLEAGLFAIRNRIWGRPDWLEPEN